MIKWSQLSNWTKCDKWKDFTVNSFSGIDLSSDPCLYFTLGKKKAVTLSLTVLVVIEMLNALNAISDEMSILQVTPFQNVYLLIAIAASISVHCMILYVPFFNNIFGIMPLDLSEWGLVLLWSVPVVLIDEFVKFVIRSVLSNKNPCAIEHKKTD